MTLQELSGEQLPIPIENPQWDRFDDIGHYIESGPTGFFGRVLPQSVWALLFAPTQADLETVRQHRRAIVRVFDDISTAYAQSNKQIQAKVKYNGADENDRDELLTVPSRTQYPVTAPHRHEETALDEHLTNIQHALSIERSLVDRIDMLLSEPHVSFLYENEQRWLRKARALFVGSTTRGAAHLDTVTERHQHLLEVLTTKQSRWEDELNELRENAEPYLDGTRYLTDDAVLTRAYTLRDALRTFQRTTSISALDNESASGFNTLITEVETLINCLEVSRTEFADGRSTEVASAVSQTIEELTVVIEGPRTFGTAIENPQSLLAQISSVRAMIATYEDEPYTAHVSDHRTTAIARYKRDLDSIEMLIKDRSELLNVLEHRVDKWAELQETLSKRARPYLELTEYLTGDALLDDVRTLASDLALFRSEHDVHSVVHPAVDRFARLEQSVEQLLTALEKSRRRISEQQTNKIESSVQTSIGEIEAELRGARVDGTLIELPTVCRVWITAVRDTITEFEASPYTGHLSGHRVGSIVAYREELDELEAFIDAKVEYDAEIKTHKRATHRLVDRARPYLEYDQYLTRPARTQLVQQTNTVKRDLQTFANRIDVTLLSEIDQNRLSVFEDTTDNIHLHLEGYNDRFVARQQDACKDLFSNLGPNQLSLTTEQELAVIRNGLYNQVIAAAGTGKTLALTTRVAYLIEDRGIDPERILVLTYTTEATKEMATRLKTYFGIDDVEVRTVHGFGRKLIKTERGGPIDVIAKEQKRNLIDRELGRARREKNSAFLEHYYKLLMHFDAVSLEEADFETKEAYVAARREQDYLTLRGQKVKSRAEKYIADFLFTHQVEYRYEDYAMWAETGDNKQSYTPDFYLPDYDSYIEHWGIDKYGKTPSWFSISSEEYRAKMVWARDQFEASDYSLVQTFEYEHQAGQLDEVLTKRLTDAGIELNRMSFEELVNSVFDYDQREGKIKAKFEDFIDNARQFDVRPDAIEAALSVYNPRQYHFAKCGIYLLQRYVLYLAEYNLIDYSDMIKQAVGILRDETTTYHKQYDHVLVDEFQDIGTDKLDLIKELVGPQRARLFAVGDDWQSIYSFQGAVVDYFVDFESHFGPAVRTDLSENFRSPTEIVEMGSHAIAHNETQLEKQVRAAVDRHTVPRVHPLQGYDDTDYQYRVQDYAIALVKEYYERGADPADIMVLCRFDDATWYLDNIKRELRSLGIPYVGNNDQYRGPNGDCEDGVAVYSVYQSKGREASHVILLHTAEGPYGFPPTRPVGDLLTPVQPIAINTLEEERRVFYVALTRPKDTLDILTQVGKESRFLDEVSAFTEVVDSGRVNPLGEVGELMTVTVRVSKLFKPHGKQHQTGYLNDRYGGSAKFVSWKSNHPPTLEEGEWYTMSRVQVREYNGKKELGLPYHSTIRHLEDDNPGAVTLVANE